jgi:hypothetical protein
VLFYRRRDAPLPLHTNPVTTATETNPINNTTTGSQQLSDSDDNEDHFYDCESKPYSFTLFGKSNGGSSESPSTTVSQPQTTNVNLDSSDTNNSNGLGDPVSYSDMDTVD